MNTIIIGRVKDPGGCWGNMAPFPVTHEGVTWRTTEALFQAMRFEDESIREMIRMEKSPMGAKMKAKANVESMTVVQLSEQDLDNMRLVLRLKIEQHPELKQQLIESEDAFIVENCTNRPHGSGLFWGSAFKDGKWEGQNWLGKLWMELRSEIKTPA